MRILVKIGGRPAADPSSLGALAAEFKARSGHDRLVLVHGGGPAVSGLQERLGLTPRFVDGIRQTGSADMEAADMGLAGAVNTSLVRLFQGSGVPAVGLTGADIRNMVNEAALWAARQDKKIVDMSDFDYARDKILMGAKREEILTEKEKKRKQIATDEKK